MALSYLTGQRRIPGRDFFGQPVKSDGPVPGFAFLGRTTPSEDPPGIRVLRPWESGREIGLAPGDVITSVDGQFFQDGGELHKSFVSNYAAGEPVSLKVVRNGEPPRDFRLVLKPFLRNPGDLGLPYEDVEIRSSNGFTLRGWFIPPPEGSDGRAGVFVHGAKSSRFQGLEGAKHWYRRGYGLLTMDLSGRGTSDGEYVTYTVNERHDVASMARWLRQKEGVRPDAMVVFGTSNGAAASIYAAAEDPALAALALDAPFADLWAAAGEMLGSRGVSPWLRYPLSLAVRWRAGIDLKRIRPIDAIEEIRAPILFVHGDADNQVPPYHTELLVESRRQAGLPTERWVLPGGEHGFDNYPPPGIFWNRILDFFDSALGGAPPELTL
jgi:dipeptidyl aminopeptidase/acylaminoacyl peptidase